VQDAIDRLVAESKKTIILIAHRLSTVRKCNKIMVLERGKIAEIGDNKSLLELNGIYRKLVDKQLHTAGGDL
jgi:ABC-type multidrug transport system fused ATPase/permease subunit